MSEDRFCSTFLTGYVLPCTTGIPSYTLLCIILPDVMESNANLCYYYNKVITE